VIFLYGCLALLAALTILCSILVVRVGQARRASRKPNCYYCGGKALRASSPRGSIDLLLAYWNCLPHRCEICFHRQYRLADRTVKEDL
jgi:hypothetical protein